MTAPIPVVTNTTKREKSMRNAFADMVEQAAAGLGAIFKTSMPAYCDIETADSATSLVTTKGTLVSGIRIVGINAAMGPDEFESMTANLERALQSYLSSPAHTVDVFAGRDATGARAQLREMSNGARKTCDTLGLDMGDIIAANEQALSGYVAAESVYIALWTRPSFMAKSDYKEGVKKQKEARMALPPTTMSAQNIISTLPDVRERHEATIGSIYEDLQKSGVRCEILSSHEMLRVARMEIDPGQTHPDWKPQLVGDVIPLLGAPAYLRDESATQLDFSDIQYPPVAWQMFPREAKRVNAKQVIVGDRAFAPVFIEIPPNEVMPFSNLFEKLTSVQIPWRVMFRLDGGGLSYIGVKGALSAFLSITSSHSKRFAKAIKDLQSLNTDAYALVRMRISFCTWAPANDLGLLSRRASRLTQTVSAWGQCEVREVSGDAMLGMVSTVPFFSEECAANACVAPLRHVVRMLPFMRPASPWDSGSMLFRTMDGKLMPFQPGSSKQSTWIYLLSGRPGYGKSVQMLNIILGTCMQPGLSRLPRVGIVDIGPSSMYFVNMLKESLPLNKRHLVASFKLSMRPEHAINPFDLPLGCRYPTPEHKAFIINALSQVSTPAEAKHPYTRISEFISKVIDHVYERYSGEGANVSAKRYSPNQEPLVDAALKNLNFEFQRNTEWWHIVDFLSANELTHEATMAQRYAVPLIEDCIQIPEHVIDLYKNIKVESNETLPDAFKSLLSSATRDFPNLACPTRFDIGEVRIAAINLEDVAKSGSDAANRQTAVMYMLASYALTRDYRFNEATVMAMKVAPMYRDYHLKKAKETREDLKWIAYDEYHRTKHSIQVRESILIDMREGRKFNIGVILASQGAKDFPPEIREFATGTFVMDAGTQDNAEELQKHFGLNETAKELLLQHVHGPKKSGAPLLAILSTKEGQYAQLLVSTMGVETLWALSSTMEDVLVREIVCARLGAAEGRRALAFSYPGQAFSTVERLRAAGERDAVAFVANDAIKKWETRQTKV